MSPVNLTWPLLHDMIQTSRILAGGSLLAGTPTLRGG